MHICIKAKKDAHNTEKVMELRRSRGKIGRVGYRTHVSNSQKKKSKKRAEEFVRPKEISGGFKHFHYSSIKSNFGNNNEI